MSDFSEKIRKLMAMADHPETNPHEAANAAAMAAELALKYNIDIDQIKVDAAPKRKSFTAGEHAIKVSARDRQAALLLCSGIAKLYGTCLLTSWRSPYNYIRFVGQEHNVLLSNTWAKYLWTACQRSTKEYCKTRLFFDNKERYRAEQTFYLQFSNEVYLRLCAKLEAMKQQGVSSTGTALVVVNWYEQERKEVQQWMNDNMSLGKPTASKPKRLDADAARAGYAAGKRVGLDEQLTGGRDAVKALR